jgi:hypothetical protein
MHLPPSSRVITADCARHTICQQCGQVVRLGRRTQAQDLVRDWTRLNCNIALFTKLHEEWVLSDAEAVADALGAEQYHIVEVGIRIAAMVVGLACVEDEREIEPKGCYFCAHGDELWYPCLVWVASILLPMHVEPCQ